MDLVDYFRFEQQRLHTAFRGAVSDLTLEEWNTVPAGTGNSIAFLLWHAVRTEDSVLHFILQGREPIWNAGNWHERLGLPERAQGTGMNTDEAQAIRLNDPALFMTYAEEVWRSGEAYLAGINDGGAELSARRVMVKPLGEMPAAQAIGQICLSHLFMHFGEIALLRGGFNKRGMRI